MNRHAHSTRTGDQAADRTFDGHPDWHPDWHPDCYPDCDPGPDPDAGPSASGREHEAPPPIRRGRGVAANVPNRFERTVAAPFDDGRPGDPKTSHADAASGPTLGTPDDDTLPPLATTLTPDRSRSAISRNISPDLGFDRAINPYRGCEHGCVYCYARPGHAYLGWSPGLDFETRLTFKPDIAVLLEQDLRRPGYVPRTIALGSSTDPYQPVDRTLALTRQVLEVLERFGHPVSIVSKSAGLLRDLDILRRLADRGLVRTWLSVTTLDPALARTMEPRAAAPRRRLQAIERLAGAGVPAGVLAAPMIPGLNDAELERILEAAASAGADAAGYTLLRLPLELRAMVETWLHQHYPQRAAHVLSLIRQTRNGQLNDSRSEQRFTGQGPYADLLAQRFALAVRRHRLPRPAPLRCDLFRVPPRLPMPRSPVTGPSVPRSPVRTTRLPDRQLALF